MNVDFLNNMEKRESQTIYVELEECERFRAQNKPKMVRFRSEIVRCPAKTEQLIEDAQAFEEAKEAERIL